MANGPEMDDILPQVTRDSLTADDFALLAADLLPASPRGDTVAGAMGPLCVWWGLVLTAANGWIATGHPLPYAGWIAAGAGVVGSLPLVWLLMRDGLLHRWWTQTVPVTVATAAVGSLILLYNNDILALCVVAAILLAVMAGAARLPWLFIAVAGWIVAGLAGRFLPAPGPFHLMLGAATLLFLLLPGIKLWRQTLRQSALQQLDLL